MGNAGLGKGAGAGLGLLALFGIGMVWYAGIADYVRARPGLENVVLVLLAIAAVLAVGSAAVLAGVWVASYQVRRFRRDPDYRFVAIASRSTRKGWSVTPPRIFLFNDSVVALRSFHRAKVLESWDVKDIRSVDVVKASVTSRHGRIPRPMPAVRIAFRSTGRNETFVFRRPSLPMIYQTNDYLAYVAKRAIESSVGTHTARPVR